MTVSEIQSHVLDAIPYPIIFVDMDHSIRYLNREARHQYYEVRGYGELVGRSLFDCHNERSREAILAAVEKLKNHGNEVYLGVSVRNLRKYINPVRDEQGVMIGYFERFELNLQK